MKVRTYLLAGILALGFTSCGQGGASRKGGERLPAVFGQGQNNLNDRPGYLDQQRNFNPSNRQFRIFDQNFDFNPADNIPTQALAQRFPVSLGNDSQIAWLGRGEQFFAARMHLLNNARRSVRIQSLLFEDDESSRLIANKLIELVNRGVQVKVIVDPVINYTIANQTLYYRLQRNGVMIEGYEAFYLNYFSKGAQMNDLGLTIGEANMRYHEKLFIIDGEDPVNGMAITGGVNLGNNYFRADPTNTEEMWRDRDVLVRGKIVDSMTRSFEQNYQEFFQKRSEGLFGDTSQIWGWANTLFGSKGYIEMDDMDPEILARLRSFTNQPFQPQWVSGDIRFVQSRPRFKEDLIMPAFLDMINRSQTEILINNSYFLPDEDFTRALKAAVSRGVKVKIITNHVDNTDFSQLHLLARTSYKDFLVLNTPALQAQGNGDTPIEIYEWAGDPVLGNGEGLNHSKYAVFDRKAVMVGSFNIDPRSRSLNSESVVFFESEQAASLYYQEFESERVPRYAQKVSLFQAQSFTDPGGLKEKLELQISEILRPFL